MADLQSPGLHTPVGIDHERHRLFAITRRKWRS